jgi:hypothetical protein
MQFLLLMAVLVGFVGNWSLAQQSDTQTLPNAPSASAQSQPAPAAQSDAGTLQSTMARSVSFFQLLQEKSLVFPDLATDRGPLDSWGKFKLAANNSIALPTIGAALVGSAYGQASQQSRGIRTGGAGYGKRFGADMARAASANMFGTFLVASLTHQDPRFYVQKHLNFKESVKYAATRLVIARSDSGERWSATATFWAHSRARRSPTPIILKARAEWQYLHPLRLRPGLEVRREPAPTVLAANQSRAATASRASANQGLWRLGKRRC